MKDTAELQNSRIVEVIVSTIDVEGGQIFQYYTRGGSYIGTLTTVPAAQPDMAQESGDSVKEEEEENE